MKLLDFSRYALSSCVAAPLLAGCGSQPPIGAPGAMPQTSAIAMHADRGKSWMLPEAKNEDLVYVTTSSSTVSAYSLKTGKLVGSLTGFTIAWGLCTGQYGDVFVVDYGTFKIYEYPHGGTKPKNVLQSPGWSFSYAVDPTTGNLAVTNGGISGGGDLAVWKGARGKPKAYSAAGFLDDFWYCTYDDQGNLFADGESDVSDGPTPELVELHRHAKSLTHISLNMGPYSPIGAVLWDGKFLAIAGGFNGEGFAQLEIRKDQWTQHGDGVYLAGANLEKVFSITPAYSRSKNRVLIAGATVNSKSVVGYWHYPSGGEPFATIANGLGDSAVSVTVSTVPQ
jgi:hypothetical protein